jgi:hypothetical protein
MWGGPGCVLVLLFYGSLNSIHKSVLSSLYYQLWAPLSSTTQVIIFYFPDWFIHFLLSVFTTKLETSYLLAPVLSQALITGTRCLTNILNKYMHDWQLIICMNCGFWFSWRKWPVGCDTQLLPLILFPWSATEGVALLLWSLGAYWTSNQHTPFSHSSLALLHPSADECSLKAG